MRGKLWVVLVFVPAGPIGSNAANPFRFRSLLAETMKQASIQMYEVIR